MSLTATSVPRQIYFWEDQQRNLTERVKTLFLAENGVKLKNLTGYTTYMVSVAAFNAAGDGPRSTPTRGQTQQAGGEKAGGRGVVSLGSGGRLSGEWRRLIPPAGSYPIWAGYPVPMGLSRVGEHSPQRGASMCCSEEEVVPYSLGESPQISPILPPSLTRSLPCRWLAHFCSLPVST